MLLIKVKIFPAEDCFLLKLIFRCKILICIQLSGAPLTASVDGPSILHYGKVVGLLTELKMGFSWQTIIVNYYGWLYFLSLAKLL